MAERMNRDEAEARLKEFSDLKKPKTIIGKFDRLADWSKFNGRMVEYLEIPIKKYGGSMKMPDLLHFTGLRIMCWHLVKYSMRLWLGAAKRHDFEKIAHYAQMAWTLAGEQGREAPFFNEDVEGDYIIARGEGMVITLKVQREVENPNG